MPTFMIGEVHVKPERKEDLLASFAMLKMQSGFISHDIYQSSTDENHLTTIEQWENPDDHQNFIASLPEGAMDKWVEMLSQPPVISSFTRIG